MLSGVLSGVAFAKKTDTSRKLLFASLTLVMLAFCGDAFAHAVAQGDKGYIQEISGVNLIAFTYLGAKHMVTGYDHLLFLLGVIFFLYLLHQDFVGWIYSLDLEYCFAEIFLMLNTINSRDVYSESDNESLTKIYKRSRDELIAQRDYLEFVQNKILYYATIEPSILSYLENKFVDQNSIRISLNKGTNRNDIFAHSSDIRAPEDYKVFEHKAQFLMGRNIKLSDIERWRESENRKHREYLKTHSQTELF